MPTTVLYAIAIYFNLNPPNRSLGASQVVLVVENPPANVGDIRDPGSIPGLGRSSGGGLGDPLQYFCLENLMNRGTRKATVPRIAQSQTQLKQLSQTSKLDVTLLYNSLVNGCSAASCNFGVLTGEDEHTSFYSTMLMNYSEKGEKKLLT